jgi:hypothetical protein
MRIKTQLQVLIYNNSIPDDEKIDEGETQTPTDNNESG